jgi:hypothetical protein
MREMITGADGAPTFAMRVFDLTPGATRRTTITPGSTKSSS